MRPLRLLLVALALLTCASAAEATCVRVAHHGWRPVRVARHACYHRVVVRHHCRGRHHLVRWHLDRDGDALVRGGRRPVR